MWRPLEITVVSAKDLEYVNHLTTMDVYAAVSIEGDPSNFQRQRTHVHKLCGLNPTWNCTMKFSLDEAALQRNDLTLKFRIMSDRGIRGDKEIGEVHIPIKKLFDQEAAEDGTEPKNVSNDVRSASKIAKGTLNFTYKFGEEYNGQPSSAPHPHAPGGYEAPSTSGTNPYPPQQPPMKRFIGKVKRAGDKILGLAAVVVTIWGLADRADDTNDPNDADNSPDSGV